MAAKRPGHLQIAYETKKIPVVEIFGPTIQGEGTMAGQQTFFLRTGGCDYRCVWCDSMHAVLPELVKKNSTPHTQKELYDKYVRLGDIHGVNTLTISGGNPAIHNLGGLVRSLNADMWKVAVETQGSIWQDWLGIVHTLTISPKPPSADAWKGNISTLSCLQNLEDFVCLLLKASHNTNVRKFAVKEICFKVVIATDEDLEFFKRARDIMLLVENVAPVYYYVQPKTEIDKHMSDEQAISMLLNSTRVLAEQVLSMQMGDVRVMPQMHTLIWGRKQGV